MAGEQEAPALPGEVWPPALTDAEIAGDEATAKLVVEMVLRPYAAAVREKCPQIAEEIALFGNHLLCVYAHLRAERAAREKAVALAKAERAYRVAIEAVKEWQRPERLTEREADEAFATLIRKRGEAREALRALGVEP